MAENIGKETNTQPGHLNIPQISKEDTHLCSYKSTEYEDSENTVDGGEYRRVIKHKQNLLKRELNVVQCIPSRRGLINTDMN